MFGREYPFEKAYPDVDEITVEYKEVGHMLKDYQKQSNSMSKVQMTRVLPCHNVSCKNGGFHIDEIIRNMNAKKQTSKADGVMCSGTEPTMKRECLFPKTTYGAIVRDVFESGCQDPRPYAEIHERRRWWFVART